MRYLLLKNINSSYYIARYESGHTIETAEITEPIIPDEPMTVNSFINHTFYPYDAEKIVDAEEVKNYDSKWGIIGDPDYYSLKFIESLFPKT